MSFEGHHPFGLLVTVGYLIVAMLAWSAAISFARVNPAGRARDQARARVAAWALTGLIALALAVVKILGIEARITAHFRAVIVAAGQYADHRDEQLIDLIWVVGLAIPIGIAVLVIVRKAGERALAALAVALLLAGFVGVRMLSYHDIDALLAMNVRGFNLSNAIELTGIVVVAILAESRPSSSWISQSVSSHRPRRRPR